METFLKNFFQKLLDIVDYQNNKEVFINRVVYDLKQNIIFSLITELPEKKQHEAIEFIVTSRKEDDARENLQQLMNQGIGRQDNKIADYLRIRLGKDLYNGVITTVLETFLQDFFSTIAQTITPEQKNKIQIYLESLKSQDKNIDSLT